MSMDKAIEHHKEFRKKYYGAKSMDPSRVVDGHMDDCELHRLLEEAKDIK